MSNLTEHILEQLNKEPITSGIVNFYKEIDGNVTMADLHSTRSQLMRIKGVYDVDIHISSLRKRIKVSVDYNHYKKCDNVA